MAFPANPSLFQATASVRGGSLIILLVAIPLLCLAQDKKLDSLQALLPDAKDTTEVIILNQLSERVRSKNPAKAIAWSEQALEKSKQLGYSMGKVVSLHDVGIAHGFNNNFVLATDYLIQSSQEGEKINAWKTVADNYMNIGSMYSVQGNNEKWIAYYLKSLKIYEQIQDKKGIANILYGIGNSLATEKKYDQALDNFFKSIEYFEELNEVRELPKVYVNVGSVYKDLKDYPKALEYFGKALDDFAAYNNLRGRAMALNHRGETYYLQGRNNLAITDLNEAIQTGNNLNYQIPVVGGMILIGRVYQSQKEYDKAIDYVFKAATLARKIKSNVSVSEAYQLLSDLYLAKGDYRSAFNFQGLHASYQDSLFTAEKSKQIQELQVRFDTEKKGKEIEILKQEQALNSIYLGSSLGIVAFILIIGYLIINRQKVIIRKDRELSSKENQILEERKSLIEAELLNRRLNEEQLHRQIEFNNKEMTTYALNLIQKNELLDNIKAGIEEMRAVEGDQIKPKLQSLLNTVNYSFHLDKDWENFRLHFEQVHQSFFDKLNELYPDLGASDIKLCALLRLNLDTKAMATVLDISPESAKVARHRLRKKLNLATDQNLTAFLTNM